MGSGRRIEPDFIRGVAILLAMGWHFNDVHTGNVVVDALMAPGRTIGWAGVDLFFVLSGYLIGGLLFGEVKRTGQFRAGRFLARRAMKIWPVFYAFLLFYLCLQFKPWQTWLWQNALHVQNFFGSPISHLWSLAVEEHFYFAAAVLFSFAVSRGAGRRAIGLALAGVMLASLVARCVAVWLDVDGHTLQTLTPFRIDSLAAGVLLAHLRANYRQVFERAAEQKMVLAGVVASGVAFISSFDAHGAMMCSIGYTVAYFTAAATILLCHQAKIVTGAGAFARCVARPLAAVGVFSYALYVWHVVMIRASLMVSGRVHFGQAEPYALLAIRYGGALVLAVAVTKALEIPFLRLRDRVFPASGTAATVALDLASDNTTS